MFVREKRIRMWKPIPGAMLCLTLVWATGLSQQSAGKVFYVESWKRGSTRICETDFFYQLDRITRRHEAVIRDAAGTERYRLIVRFLEREGNLFDSWAVELREKLDGGRLGPNLLGSEGPGPSGDYFPKENQIALLYPVEEPNFLRYGIDVYPIRAKRVIKVESFYVIIQVEDYKLDREEPKRLEKIDVRIQLSNSIEGAKHLVGSDTLR
jgi:hypothetical protein